MPSWFNIEGIDSDGTGFFPVKEDPNDIENSTKTVLNLIDGEASMLGEHGKSRIMIGGVSGGGVIALNTLLQSKDKLAGCVALSTYIADWTHQSVIPKITGKLETPVLQCHGKDDIMLSIHKGKMTSKLLSSLVQEHQFHLVPKMGHEPSEEAMNLFKQFIHQKLPPHL